MSAHIPWPKRVQLSPVQKLLICLVIVAISCTASVSADSQTPRYKPSGSSPEPLDITLNSYGFSRTAPQALAIGEQAPDFTLPSASGGKVNLMELAAAGPVVIIFYRGHW